jgi:hypothetical protein
MACLDRGLIPHCTLADLVRYRPWPTIDECVDPLMDRKKLAIIIAVFGILAGYVYATPYITLFMLKGAIEAKSAKEVEKFIDFSDVRDSLRSQLTDYLQDQVINGNESEGFAQLAAGIGNAVGSTYIDALVRPGSLQKWLDGESNNEQNGAPSIPLASELTEHGDKYSLNYKSFETFEVKLREKGVVSGFTLERRNIIGWKIVGITVDVSSLESASRKHEPEASLPETPEATVSAQESDLVDYTGTVPGDDIIHVDRDDNWYYRCMGSPPKCPTRDLIYGGKYTRISGDVIKVESDYYCRRDTIPGQGGLSKCTENGYELVPW